MKEERRNKRLLTSQALFVEDVAAEALRWIHVDFQPVTLTVIAQLQVKGVEGEGHKLWAGGVQRHDRGRVKFVGVAGREAGTFYDPTASRLWVEDVYRETKQNVGY